VNSDSIRIDELLDARDDAPWRRFASAPEAERRAVVLALKSRVDGLMRSHPREAPAVAEALVRAAAGLADLQPIALRGRALAAHGIGRHAEAEADYRKALELHEQLGQPIEAARVLRTLVGVLQMLGRAPEALACGARAREIFAAHGERALVAQTDVNVGNVLVRLDDYAKARPCLEAARDTFRELGDALGEAFADFALAVVEMNANRVEVAQACWERARAGYAAADMSVPVADCDYSLAYLESRRGRFAEALAGLDRARAAYEVNGKPGGVPLCDLDAAEILLRLDARRDAFDHAQRAAAAFASLGLDYERARAEVLCGLARARSGDAAGALDDLASAIARFSALGNDAYAAAAELQRAALQVRAGEPLTALPKLLDARRRLAAADLQLLADLATITLARARLDAGDAGAALAELDALLATDRADRVLDDLLRAEAQAVAAAAHRARGDLAAAVRARRAAIESVERNWAAAPSRDVRVAFFRDQHPIWVDLAWDLADLGQPGEALAALESGRARGHAEAGLAPAESDELRAARTRLEWLMLRRLDAEFGPATSSHELRRATVAGSDVAEAQRELARLLREPAPGGGPVAPSFGAAELAAAQGGADDVLLVYLVAPQGVRVLVADGRSVRAVTLPADARTLASLRDRLWLHVDRLRLGPGHRAAAARSLAPVLAELGARLIEPLARELDDRPLAIVPYGDLHELPFHAFRVGGRPLVARHDVTYGLSAGQLAQVRGKPPSTARNVLATGVLHAGLPRIPEEIEALEKLWGSRLERLAPEDLFVRLQTTSRRAGMLHLAGHGLFEPGHPSFSAVCLGSRFLMAHDIRRLSLDLGLVVLSGCETGRRRRVGGEELLGLPSAWLAAGARAVLGSLWAVEDGDARDAALGLHVELERGATARQALARAQRELIAQGRDELGWAALSLTGDPETNIEAQGAAGARDAAAREAHGQGETA
jgi:tetratricopeptide (TPR) repeat protein